MSYPPPHGYPPPADPYYGAPPGYGPPPAYAYGPPPAHPSHYPPPGYGPPPPGYPPYGLPPPGYPGYAYPPPPGAYPPPGYPPPGPFWPPPPGAYSHPYGPGYGYPPRASSRSVSPRRRDAGSGNKYTCRFFIGIENEGDFKVAKRIIGASGVKMKDIVSKSGGFAKLRLRGKGSGFVEKDTNEESPEPLQLCISCPEERGYNIARRSAEELLLKVYAEYDKWCEEQGKPERAPAIKMSEKHLAGDSTSAGNNNQEGRSGRGESAANKKQKNMRGKQKKQKKDLPSTAPAERLAVEDRGEAPPEAPPVEEIEKLISERNDCRKRGDYSKADEIRVKLKRQRVVLSDEKGGHGDGLMVTSWRYWNE